MFFSRKKQKKACVDAPKRHVFALRAEVWKYANKCEVGIRKTLCAGCIRTDASRLKGKGFVQVKSAAYTAWELRSPVFATQLHSVPAQNIYDVNVQSVY